MNAAPASQATVHYGDGEFAVLNGGTFVRCAVTGQAIALPALRYWSAARQEAYVGPLEFLKATGADTAAIQPSA
ncbi:hypothetical protein OB03_07850 [Brevundimonas sp. GN22]